MEIVSFGLESQWRLDHFPVRISVVVSAARSQDRTYFLGSENGAVLAVLIQNIREVLDLRR